LLREEKRYLWWLFRLRLAAGVERGGERR
jgi:hypothetical protein